jgi:mono/diheme cytochrome c family protein
MRNSKIFSAFSTALLLGVVAADSIPMSGAAAKPMKSMKMSMLAEGKNITTTKGCVKCHGSNLNGIPQFSPGLSKTGVLKEYNKSSFEVVMNTGKTNDGGMVTKPMPIYHFKSAQSDALYAYLVTLK